MKISVPKPRVTRVQLESRLTELGVAPGIYSLYGTGQQADGYCMDQLPLGKWVVYYAERGARSRERHFDDEGDACEHLFRRLQAAGDVPAEAVLT